MFLALSLNAAAEARRRIWVYSAHVSWNVSFFEIGLLLGGVVFVMSPLRIFVRFCMVLTCALMLSGSLLLGVGSIVPRVFSHLGLDVWSVPGLLLEEGRRVRDSLRIDREIRRLADQNAEKEAIVQLVLRGELSESVGLARFEYLVADCPDLCQRLIQSSPHLTEAERVRAHFDLYLEKAREKQIEVRAVGGLL